MILKNFEIIYQINEILKPLGPMWKEIRSRHRKLKLNEGTNERDVFTLIGSLHYQRVLFRNWSNTGVSKHSHENIVSNEIKSTIRKVKNIENILLDTECENQLNIELLALIKHIKNELEPYLVLIELVMVKNSNEY